MSSIVKDDRSSLEEFLEKGIGIFTHGTLFFHQKFHQTKCVNIFVEDKKYR